MKPIREKILVVEDDPFIRDLLQQELQDLGYGTNFLSNGGQALRTAQETKPDLILLDIMMPGVDGYSVCRALRNDPSVSQIPVVFITAKGSSEDIVKGLQVGANDYVTKPIDIQILAARLENQLRAKRLYDKINHQNLELENLNSTICEFLGMASHDLRTPASVIKLIASTLLDNAAGPLNEPQMVLLKKIYDQTSYMNTLLDSLLNMTRIESGKIDLHVRQENLNSLLEENLSSLKFLANQKKIDLGLTKDPSLPLVWIDRNRFTEIIDNLVSNAVKFTPEGGKIQVHVFKANATGDGNWACVSVADSGMGIQAADLGRIFEKFGKSGHTPMKGEKSTGLGLFIAKKLTELLGGKLEVTSELGKGTKFLIRLPLKMTSSLKTS